TIKYGVEIPWEEEELLSKLMPTPFFVMDYPKGSRGFYDMEDPARPGILRDFDLLYPEGYGEAVSGAEREYIYEKVVARMHENGEDPAKYGWYLEMLREGISPTSGFGIGVERLTRFVCGLRTVWEARPYPKVAGIYSP
ncbi:MAG: amino acid--tRNA ligase-related protein, partial [Nitrososphaerota archaeon]